MLRQLLESRPRRARSRGAALFSLVAHTSIVIGAVVATASAKPVPKDDPPLPKLIYLPTRTPPSHVPPTAPTPNTPQAPDQPPVIVPPIDVPPTLPPVSTPTAPWVEPVFGPTPRPGIPGLGTPDSTTRTAPSSPFGGDEVERAVVALGGTRAPRYPELLRSNRVEGTVLASYVVDTLGRVEPNSFRAVTSTHPLFEQAVRASVLATRFRAAEVGGRRVRQLVEQRFVFSLTR